MWSKNARKVTKLQHLTYKRLIRIHHLQISLHTEVKVSFIGITFSRVEPFPVSGQEIINAASPWVLALMCN